MSFFERFIERLNFEVEEPTPLGHFHLLFVLLVLAAVVGCFFLRNVSSRTFRIIIGSMFALMFILEVLKQFSFSMTFTDGVCEYSYAWTDFPFQLCSTPLYVLPLLAFLPDCGLRDFAASYTMTYGLIGGTAVYLFPDTVFTTSIFINIQTMIHHGIQLVSGVFVAFWYRKRINRKFFLGGVAIFGVMFAVANLLNTVGYDLLLSKGIIESGAKFNMFYISPRADQEMPLMSEFFKSLPPSVLIIGYFILLTVGAFLVTYAVHLIDRFSEKYASKTEDPAC